MSAMPDERSPTAASLIAELGLPDTDEEDIGMRVVEVSYTSLSAEAAQLYRLLSLHPGPDVSVPVAAAALDTDIPAARTLLDEITEAGLLVQDVQDRWRFHGLIRPHSSTKAHEVDTPAHREAALLCVLEYYRDTATDLAERAQQIRHGADR